MSELSREQIAESLHRLYLSMAKSIGWNVRPECDVPFDQLSHEGQILDLLFADWHLGQVAILRQEIERLTARHTELEQALRLHLAVSPDDPLLLTPLERQVVQLTQERDHFEHYYHAMRAEYKTLQATLARVEIDCANYREANVRQTSECVSLTLRLAQAEQREARLREALELIKEHSHHSADKSKCLARLTVCHNTAQQALSQLSTTSSWPTGSDHSETPS